MKKSVDILGLPVISINEGLELGTAKSLVINPAQGSVAALVVDDGKWYLGAKLLPFAAVTGIGESAITVETAANVVPAANTPDLEKLLAAGVDGVGAVVNGHLQLFEIAGRRQQFGDFHEKRTFPVKPRSIRG